MFGLSNQAKDIELFTLDMLRPPFSDLNNLYQSFRAASVDAFSYPSLFSFSNQTMFLGVIVLKDPDEPRPEQTEELTVAPGTSLTWMQFRSIAAQRAAGDPLGERPRQEDAKQHTAKSTGCNLPKPRHPATPSTAGTRANDRDQNIQPPQQEDDGMDSDTLGSTHSLLPHHENVSERRPLPSPLRTNECPPSGSFKWRPLKTKSASKPRTSKKYKSVLDEDTDEFEDIWSAKQGVPFTEPIPIPSTPILRSHNSQNMANERLREWNDLSLNNTQTNRSQDLPYVLPATGYDDDDDDDTASSQTLTPKTSAIVGFVYLTIPHAEGEANVGIMIDPQYRRQGLAHQAIDLVLECGFGEFKLHRVQALVIDSPSKDSAITFFIQKRFSHEGTRRRSAYNPEDGVWRDVTYLSILDTDWMMRHYLKPAPRTLWDEMFARHEREREELLRWDDKKLKRMSSLETLHGRPPTVHEPMYDSSAISQSGDDTESFVSFPDTASGPATVWTPSISGDEEDPFSSVPNSRLGSPSSRSMSSASAKWEILSSASGGPLPSDSEVSDFEMLGD